MSPSQTVEEIETMTTHPARRIRSILPVLAGLAGAFACSDDPTAPTVEDVPQALIDAVNGEGMGVGLDNNSLPQGAAPFQGPNGIEMVATASEFVQKFTRPDDVTMRTTGITIHAVPADPTGHAIDRIAFGAAVTGSTDPVQPGRYPFTPFPAGFDFVKIVPVNYASVRPVGERAVQYTDDGELVITSVDYFDDVYTCDFVDGPVVVVDRCEYIIGVVRGTIEFRAVLDDGTELVQPKTSFTLPIRRRTVEGRFLRWGS